MPPHRTQVVVIVAVTGGAEASVSGKRSDRVLDAYIEYADDTLIMSYFHIYTNNIFSILFSNKTVYLVTSYIIV